MRLIDSIWSDLLYCCYWSHSNLLPHLMDYPMYSASSLNHLFTLVPSAFDSHEWMYGRLIIMNCCFWTYFFSVFWFQCLSGERERRMVGLVNLKWAKYFHFFIKMYTMSTHTHDQHTIRRIEINTQQTVWITVHTRILKQLIRWPSIYALVQMCERKLVFANCSIDRLPFFFENRQLDKNGIPKFVYLIVLILH